MAGKIYQVAFQLAGKLGSNFGSTFLSAQKHISGLDVQIKKLKADMKAGGNKTELQAQIEGLTTQKAKFTAAHAAADKFKSSVGSAFKSAAITAGVATTAVGVYYAGAMKLAGGVMEYAKHARSAAAITGTSAQWYESMSYAAKNCGVSVENFDKSLGKMTINLGEAKKGNKEMTKMFSQLGISAQELQGMKPEDAFMRITTALNGVNDAAVRTDMARKIFGKVGTSMIPMAKMGAEGLKQLQAEAKKMGVVMGDEADKNAKAFQRAKNRFNAVFEGTKLNIGQALMPGLASGMEAIAKIAVKYQPAIKKFSNDLGQGIKDSMPEVLKCVKAIGSLTGKVYAGVKAFSNLIGGFHNLVYVGAAWIGLKMAVSVFNTGSAMVAAGKDALGLVGHIRNLHIMTSLASAKMKVVSIATKAWSLAQAGLNLVMTANPIALAVIAAIALGAAAIYVYKNWDKIRTWMAPFWNWCVSGFNNVVVMLIAAWQMFSSGAIAIFQGYTAYVQMAWNVVKNILNGDWGGALAAVSIFVDTVKNLFMPLFNWISDKWNAIKKVFSSAPSVSGGAGSTSMPEMPGHADGGIFNKEHIARFAEKGKPEAVIPLSNRSRGLSVWEQAGRALGVGKPSSGNVRTGSRGKSGFVYNDNRVFNISGNRAEVEAGINKSNNSLMAKLQSLQDEEARVSYG